MYLLAVGLEVGEITTVGADGIIRIGAFEFFKIGDRALKSFRIPFGDDGKGDCH